MVETEIVLGALEALLNRPAQPRRWASSPSETPTGAKAK